MKRGSSYNRTKYFVINYIPNCGGITTEYVTSKTIYNYKIYPIDSIHEITRDSYMEKLYPGLKTIEKALNEKK